MVWDRLKSPFDVTRCPTVVPFSGSSGDAPGSTGEASDWSGDTHESPVEAPKPPLAAHGQAVDVLEPSGDGSDWSVETPGKP